MNIRKKGKWASGEAKFVIEEKGKYIETVPEAEELLKRLRLEITSCLNEETLKEIPKILSKHSFIQGINEPIKQDVNPVKKEGRGTLIPFAAEEGNKDSVTWQCDKCGFKTRLVFEDKKCPRCGPDLMPSKEEFEAMAKKKIELEKKAKGS